MSNISCPVCTVDDVVDHKTKYECMTCGHEWDKEIVEEDEANEERVVNCQKQALLCRSWII